MSKIQWTEQTWNPIIGCTQIIKGDPDASGCLNCYAMRQAYRNQAMGLRGYQGVAKKTSKGDIVWTGKVDLVLEALEKPLRRQKPTKWFVNSMSDLFHESVPFEWVDLLFGIMALCPQHTFQVLTKRPERMLEWSEQTHRHDWCNAVIKYVWQHVAKLVGGTINLDTAIKHPGFPLPNVWLGVSTENQKAASERIPILLEVPAAVRFISAEPLLGELDLGNYLCNYWRKGLTIGSYLDWIIVGGESGFKARPCHLYWVRSIVKQCLAANVPVHVKQMGTSWAKTSGTYCLDSKGGNPELWPEDLRVREFPLLFTGAHSQEVC